MSSKLASAESPKSISSDNAVGLTCSRRLIFCLVSLLAISACTNPYYDPAKPHHTREGFRNNYLTVKPGHFLKWQWERWTQGLPKPAPPGGWNFPVVHPDVNFLKNNHDEHSATWIGHATVLLQLGGKNILTDPHFGERASPVSFAGPKRQTPLPMPLADLPHIDIVAISHNHYDHLDLGTVTALANQAGGSPRFYVPLGLARWFHDAGIADVVELDWWDAREEGVLTIHCVPVQHWSERGLFDRNQTLWSGWVIETRDARPFRFFFAGDTGYSRDFRDIAARFGGFDLAALPIGAYAPRWFMQPQHIDPYEAVQIHKDLKARRSIAVHWGTFVLSDEPLDEPPKKLREALKVAGIPEDQFLVLKHGETLRLTTQ
jgi:L-ascorbate metabolism protein UlaG (beta-lactamase superfamily)